MIESWPDSEAFEAVAGEPAMTVVPNLLVTGILAVIVGLAVAAWSVWFVGRQDAGLVLLLLSLLLLLVGGGFGPPLMGVLVAITVTRADATSARPPRTAVRTLGRAWPWLVGATVLAYLSLVPGTMLLWQLGVDTAGLVLWLSPLSFVGLLLSLVAARARDRTPTAASAADVDAM
jgi:hypothetical protein